MAVTVRRDEIEGFRDVFSDLFCLGRELLHFDAWALVCREGGDWSPLEGSTAALWTQVRPGIPREAEGVDVLELSTPSGATSSHVLFVPVPPGKGRKLGFLLFGFRRPFELTPRMRRCAEEIALQAAVLLKEKRHRERLRAVYQLSERISRLRDEEELVAEAVEILRTVFQYGHVGVFLREGNWLVSHGGAYSEVFAQDKELFRPFERLPLDRGICGRVLRTGRSALVSDVRRDPDYVAAHPEVRSELAVPIVEGGEVLGVINLESADPAAFTAEDRELLESLGRQMGVALRELRYRRALEAREGFLRALNETTDYEGLLRYILERSLRLLAPKADAGSVITYDEERQVYRFRVAINRPLDKLARVEYDEEELLKVLRPDRPTLLSRSYQLAHPISKRPPIPLETPTPGSTISIPVVDPSQGRVVAFLNVNNMDEEGIFEPEDAATLWSFREEITAVVLRARNLEKIREMAFRDPLTGVYNRHYMDQLMEGMGGFARLALVLIDIDSFSEVNDRFGHLEGDRVLRGIAALLRDNVRGEDAVVRYGGDEFLIMMPNLGTREARTTAERLQDIVSRWDPGLGGVRLSLSFGIVIWDPRGGARFEEALRQADSLLYRQRRGS
ncbi:GAF domain-containing protein [Candidatus Bipolaricaulota sp. J31]